MTHPKNIILTPAVKKIAALAVIAFFAVAAFGTLGSNSVRLEDPTKKKSLLSNKTYTSNTNFSLRSGYDYRGNNVISNLSTSNNYVRLNTEVTLQKGNITYTVPMKQKIFMGKLKVDLGNRQFQKK